MLFSLAGLYLRLEFDDNNRHWSQRFFEIDRTAGEVDVS
jgi:hypothetical protein